MKKIKNDILMRMSVLAYKQAEREANSACPYYHNQSELPRKVNDLRKLKKYDK